MTQTPSRDWKKDMEMVQEFKDVCFPGSELYTKKTINDFALLAEDSLPYWLQEAKERGEREQRLKDLVRDAIGCLMIHTSDDNSDVKRISQGVRTLYPDTPAPKEGE